MTNAFEEVDAIVHANPHTECHHWKRVHLHANVEQGHHGIAEHGDQGQRKNDAERDAPRPKGQHAEHGHRTKERRIHPRVGCCNDFIRGRHHSQIAKPEHKAHPRFGRCLSEALHVLHQRRNGLSLVVCGVERDGHHAAAWIHERIAQASRGAHALGNLGRVLRHRIPLDMALGVGLRHLTHEATQA